MLFQVRTNNMFHSKWLPLPYQLSMVLKNQRNWKNAELPEKCLDENKLTFGVMFTSANISEFVTNSNCGLGCKPNPAHQLAFISKVLFEHSHSTYWHTVYGYFPTIIVELNSCNRLEGPQSRKHLHQALYIKGLLSPDLESVMYQRWKLGWPCCHRPSPSTHHWRTGIDICPPCGPQEGSADPPQEPANSYTRHLEKWETKYSVTVDSPMTHQLVYHFWKSLNS